MTWPTSCTRPWSPPTFRCGSASPADNRGINSATRCRSQGAAAPAEVAERYFTSLLAPGKELVWFENSAHFPQWEEKARFHEFLLTTVLPATAV
jgi:pimeloyl-ACP methyl ester carboxylesterase